MSLANRVNRWSTHRGRQSLAYLLSFKDRPTSQLCASLTPGKHKHSEIVLSVLLYSPFIPTFKLTLSPLFPLPLQSSSSLGQASVSKTSLITRITQDEKEYLFDMVQQSQDTIGKSMTLQKSMISSFRKQNKKTGLHDRGVLKPPEDWFQDLHVDQNPQIRNSLV